MQNQLPAPMGAVMQPRGYRGLGFNGGNPILEMPDEFKDVQTHVIFDTLRFKAGLPILTNILELFGNTVGQVQQVANDPSSSYRKLKIDTNMSTSRNLEAGKTFILESIQFDVLSVAGIGSVQGTGDNVTYDTDLQSQTGTPRVATIAELVKQIQDTFWIETEFGSSDRLRENGLVKFFPCEYGILGFAGGGNSAVYDAVAQNGLGRARKLLYPRKIDGGKTISVSVEPNIPFTPNRDFQLRCYLQGILVRPV